MKFPFDKKPRPPEGYPAGYTADGIDVFDPALLHYPRAFVAGPPRALGADEQRALQADTAQILKLVLAAIARSSLRDHVVVRGGVTLAHWFGAEARPAKDLDLVVKPATWGPDSREAKQLLAALSKLTLDELRGRVPMIEHEVTIDSIWTYERAEGRRITLPWIWRDSVHRSVQIDVVFKEPLNDQERLESLGDASAWFASRAESLAWKLLWLETDMHAQGKDLYDAVLLARHATVSRTLLRRVFEAKDCTWHSRYEQPDFVLEWSVDWENFALEQPEYATGTARQLQERLAESLVLTP